jgi:AraC-like DNA-binding protein
MALGNAIGEDEQLLFASPFTQDPEVRLLFVSAFDSLVSEDCTLATEERVLQLLRTLALRHAYQPPRRTALQKSSRLARLARDFIEDHYSERVSLTALADRCGVSPFRLIRIFRREYGLPPHAYLKQVRVGRALTMLQQGMHVSHVAYACGFSDQSHLNRNFKSTFGMPPGSYQRSVAVVPPALAG